MQSKTGETYSLSAVLAVDGAKDFFIHHEILAPGKKTSAPHSHFQTDEFVFVIKGEVVSTEGDKSSLLQAGDCAWFLAGSKELHFLENRSGAVAELLIVSRNLPESDVKF